MGTNILSRRLLAAVAATFVAAAGLVTTATDAEGAAKCPAPAQKLTFQKQTYIDTKRAGGEPTVEQHPDGTMLYGSHAGTTHFYAPAGADPTTAAFVENYTGQTYYYWSKDLGKTWHYVPRNIPGSGFSDPEFAIDKAGNVYVSEINLVNVSVWKSSDRGRSYTMQNFFGQTIHDRQWKDGDEKDVVYIVGNSFGGGTAPTQPVGNFGHYLYKSKDGGKTFSRGIPDQGGLGDIIVDKSDGTLYEAHYRDNKLSMVAFRGARKDDFKPEENTIATQVEMLSHWPAFDIDSQGNLYIVWDEAGGPGRPHGVYYSYSTDRGKTWAPPTRVDTNNHTKIWPWLAVGSKGRVAIAWLEADRALPSHNAQTKGDHKWRVVMAQTLNGLGCAGSKSPGFNVVTATPRPMHEGTICMGGTVCQAQLIDRRLGDFFTIEIDNTGAVWSGYSDTAQGGAVALPGFVRQAGGPSFIAGKTVRPNTAVGGETKKGAGGGGGGGGGSTGGGTGAAVSGDTQATGETDDVQGAAAEEESGGALASTGARVGVFVLLAMVLIVAGTMLGRRRRASRV